MKKKKKKEKEKHTKKQNYPMILPHRIQIKGGKKIGKLFEIEMFLTIKLYLC